RSNRQRDPITRRARRPRSLSKLPPPRPAPSMPGAEPVPAQLGGLRRDVDAVSAGNVFAEDLALDLESQIHVVFLLQILRQLERHEFLDQPLWRPDGVVTAKAQFVGAEPEQQIGHDLAEI